METHQEIKKLGQEYLNARREKRLLDNRVEKAKEDLIKKLGLGCYETNDCLINISKIDLGARLRPKTDIKNILEAELGEEKGTILYTKLLKNSVPHTRITKVEILN